MSEIYLDYKVTIWNRVPINSEESLKKVMKKLEKGFLPAELYDDLNENDLGPCENLLDTEEYITPIENGEQSTIEIFKNHNGIDDVEMIWNNEPD